MSPTCLKIIHVPFGFFPDPVGGTESYVASLAAHLAKKGVQNLVAAPGSRSAEYLHAGIAVRRFPVTPGLLELRKLYGEGDDLAAREFGKILTTERPTIVHLHAFTSGVSLRLARLSRECGCPVVFTYHTPTVTCVRGTLLRGDGLCDGVVETRRCATCVAAGWGCSPILAAVLGRLPVAWGTLMGRLGLQGGPCTALRCTELMELRHQALRALFSEAHHIIAVCDWVKQLLIRNGVSPQKITRSRHGVAFDGKNGAQQNKRGEAGGRDKPSSPVALKLACLGRFHPSKGFHILVEALQRAPNLRVSLDVFGIAQDRAGAEYQGCLKRAAAGDPRINFRPPVARSQVVGLLEGYDLLAIPSQGLETGPLVALESFAAGTPVIGSRLGGIAETVRDGVDGLLVEAASAEAWIAALRQCSVSEHFMERLREGVRPPRTMDDVAQDMATLYRAVL